MQSLNWCNMDIKSSYREENKVTLFCGDCLDLLTSLPSESVGLVVTSPPYCMKKAYEDKHDDIKTFTRQHERVFNEIYRILKVGGSICWQVGYHVSNSAIVPLDYIVYDIFTRQNDFLPFPIILRNRIIWTFGHGFNNTKRFSGRHEMILWFTKGEDYVFNLDDIRVPQKYPGKRAYKGVKKGELSCNPLGKNPSDVWDVPNVKAKHVEKTKHPCQFPVAIPQRLIKALTNENDLVLDPYTGSGSTAVAAVAENRRFVGAEIKNEYCDISKKRLDDLQKGVLRFRRDVPVFEPNLKSKVAQLPEDFRIIRRK